VVINDMTGVINSQQTYNKHREIFLLSYNSHTQSEMTVGRRVNRGQGSKGHIGQHFWICHVGGSQVGGH